MPAVVIDENVPIVANRKHERAGPDCVRSCIVALRQSRGQVIVIDEGQRILSKYRTHLSPRGQPGAGDAWFKWLWDNRANRKRCRCVSITPHTGSDTDFEEYPLDPDLARFDPADRVFVAIAIASGLNPPILNVSDTDWWHVRQALERNGVIVRFLCDTLMP
ncbi:MAG TPA: hypothetical protein VKT77_03365 [Chthonomonadaceae bacterium]|nr:hypothetical protein [Chthonomonadaceae bacterium]